jgi:hypothetical protein
MLLPQGQRAGREEGPQAFRADLVGRIMPVRGGALLSHTSFRASFQKPANRFHVAITEILLAKGLYLDVVAELISRTCASSKNGSKHLQPTSSH